MDDFDQQLTDSAERKVYFSVSMFRLAFLTLVLLTSSLMGWGQMHGSPRWPEVEGWLDAAAKLELEEDRAVNDYKEANRLIVEESWSEAAQILETLYAEDEGNRNLAYKLALCLRRMKGRLGDAVPLAQHAAQGEFARRYNAFDLSQRLPSEEAMELALDVLQHAGHFAEASAMAQQLLDRYPPRDYRHEMAEQAVKDCAFAMACTAQPRDMGIVSENVLNSIDKDFAPVIAPDGTALYFTSYRDQTGPEAKKKGRLYRALRTPAGWDRPERMALGSASEDVTTVGVLGDEEALLVHRGRRSEGNVWTVRWDEKGELEWGEKLEEPIASKHWETAMTERFDGQERIFVSDRPGGRGGRDLYRTVRLPDGSWSEPLNLGSRINTPGEEESPVLSADGRSLVFSSNGHQGMGGFDLFRCVRLDNGSWSEPEHMGHPLNTAGDEVMVSLDASGQTGFLSSSREGGADLDIFSVEIYDEPEEALAVFIGEVLQWKEGDVLEVKSVDQGEPIFRVYRARPESGSFVAALPACREYRFTWMRGMEVLQSRSERVACDAAYGKGRKVGRLDPFGWAEEELPKVEKNEGVVAPVTGETEEAPEPEVRTAPELAMENAALPSHAFDDAADETAVEAEPTPVTLVEFAAVSSVVEFGYGRYLTRSSDQQVKDMVREIQSRRALGEVPVLEIEGSASYVPVKDHQAYKSNDHLARMRAEKARDAIIRALSAQGMEVGIDFIIVLDWGVAGPSYQGDATAKRSEYRNYQYAKFSLGRQLIERR